MFIINNTSIARCQTTGSSHVAFGYQVTAKHCLSATTFPHIKSREPESRSREERYCGVGRNGGRLRIVRGGPSKFRMGCRSRLQAGGDCVTESGAGPGPESRGGRSSTSQPASRLARRTISAPLSLVRSQRLSTLTAMLSRTAACEGSRSTRAECFRGRFADILPHVLKHPPVPTGAGSSRTLLADNPDGRSKTRAPCHLVLTIPTSTTNRSTDRRHRPGPGPTSSRRKQTDSPHAAGGRFERTSGIPQEAVRHE